MTVCGFFGKLPALGDFVSRRVAEDFLEIWDDWLQRGIAYSHEALAANWVQIYMQSPIWRFALPAGYAGKDACCGILMPSVDRVGRKFPLTLVARLDPAPMPLILMAEAEGFFDAAEDLALSTLNPVGFALDDFEGAVAALAPRLSAARPGAGANGRDVAWLLPLPFDEALERNIPALLGDRAKSELDGFAFWWTLGSDRVEPCLLVCGVPPAAAGFRPMLDGNWDDGYWQEVVVRTRNDDADSAAVRNENA